jgi:hypothetical protein
LSEDIPDSDPFFPKYGPSFELAITQGMRTNSNSAQDLDDILEEAFGKIYWELCGISNCLELFSISWSYILEEAFGMIYWELCGRKGCLRAL